MTTSNLGRPPVRTSLDEGTKASLMELENLVVETIKHQKLLPGEKISAHEIAKMLDRSQVHVSETLAHLSRRDIIQHVPGNGYFVPCYNLHDIVEIYIYLYELVISSINMFRDNRENKVKLISSVESFQFNDKAIWDSCHQSASFSEQMLEKLAKLTDNRFMLVSMKDCLLRTFFLRRVDFGKSARRAFVRDMIFHASDLIDRNKFDEACQYLRDEKPKRIAMLSDIYVEYLANIHNNSATLSYNDNNKA